MQIIGLHHQVVTRDGRQARILSMTEKNQMGPYLYPILAEVEHPNEPGEWVAWHYMANGQWKSNDPENHNDLIPFVGWKPERKTAKARA